MKRKEENKYFLLLYYILAIFITVAVIITLSTASYLSHRHYDMQIEASNKTINSSKHTQIAKAGKVFFTPCL